MKYLPKHSGIFVVLFLFSLAVFAQKPPIKLGDVEEKEVAMTVYEPEPDADAVVLCDYGYLSFTFSLNDNEWQNQLRRICRIKIFNDDGYKWATEMISLYDDNQTEQSISQIKGYTHNMENGKVVSTKLEKEHIFEEKTSENYNRVKFTMPNVKEGSVIEFSYTVNSNYITILDKWQFQKSIPVKWSEYYVAIPEYLSYLKNAQGFEVFHTYETESKPRFINWVETERGTSTLRSSTPSSTTQHKIDYVDEVFHWVAKDMPGIKDEKFVGNYENYFQSVDFQLSHYKNFSKVSQTVLNDWTQVVDKFLNTYDNFGPNMKKKTFYKDITEKVLAEYQDPAQRTMAVYNYVSNYMKWDKHERFMPSQNIKKTYDERTGSSADINALLVSMLRAVEVDADPVIISTVSNGLVHPVWPIIDKYNYLIVRAKFEDSYVLLDATEKDIPFSLLPYRDLNLRGYAISEKNPGWVSLIPNKVMKNSTMCLLSLDDQGLATCDLSVKAEGYSALNIRSKISQDGLDKFIESVKSNHVDWAIDDIKIDVPDEIDLPVKENIHFEKTGAAEAMGNMIYIDPILSGKIDENPFKQDNRKFPIEFLYPRHNSYMLNMEIPEGYVVDELPESINLVIPDRSASFKYVTQVNGNRIQLIHSWQIDESFYPIEKFFDLKEFYKVLVAKQSEQIVLKKKVSN